MQLTRPVFDLDENGYGQVVYDVVLDGQHYSLICYSQALAPENRTDRVIAEAWDACFILFDGQPTKDDIEHLKAHATVQEAGEYATHVVAPVAATRNRFVPKTIALGGVATGSMKAIEPYST